MKGRYTGKRQELRFPSAGGRDMGYWNSRGLRGSALEELINFTNDFYLEKGIALIQKIPTPITPVAIDKQKRTITLAYFDKQSTVDYIGVAQGVPLCFDAKETALKSLPLQNIHSHQIAFMEAFQKQRGVAFLLVCFKEYNEFYFMPIEDLKPFWDAAQKGDRKSIPYDAFQKKYLIRKNQSALLDYLEAVNVYFDTSGA